MTHFLTGLTKRCWQFETRKTSRVTLNQAGQRGLLLGVGGHGKVQFGVQTQYLLGQLPEVSAVICLGAGGGLADNMKIGDVVISEKTIEHDYIERFDPEGQLPEYLGHSSLLERVKKGHGLSSALGYDIHFGSVASGDEDIIDSQRAEALYQRTKALAVAWEGAGGARACEFNGIPFLEVRVITDNARSTVRESFVKNLPLCMDNAADFIHQAFFE